MEEKPRHLVQSSGANRRRVMSQDEKLGEKVRGNSLKRNEEKEISLIFVLANFSSLSPVLLLGHTKLPTTDTLIRTHPRLALPLTLIIHNQ